MDAAEYVAWATYLEAEEDRRIAETAAAIARFWHGENTWRSAHYLAARKPSYTEDDLRAALSARVGLTTEDKEYESQHP